MRDCSEEVDLNLENQNKIIEEGKKLQNDLRNQDIKLILFFIINKEKFFNNKFLYLKDINL